MQNTVFFISIITLAGCCNTGTLGAITDATFQNEKKPFKANFYKVRPKNPQEELPGSTPRRHTPLSGLLPPDRGVSD